MLGRINRNALKILKGIFVRGEFLLFCGRRGAAEQDFLTAGSFTIKASGADAANNAPHLARLSAISLRLKLQDLAGNLAFQGVGS